MGRSTIADADDAKFQDLLEESLALGGGGGGPNLIVAENNLRIPVSNGENARFQTKTLPHVTITTNKTKTIERGDTVNRARCLRIAMRQYMITWIAHRTFKDETMRAHRYAAATHAGIASIGQLQGDRFELHLTRPLKWHQNGADVVYVTSKP